jgi:hypothetical protein
VRDAGQGGRALVRDTEAAIIGDPELSEAQRFALLSVYRSFVPGRSAGRSQSARSSR